jgi:fructose-1,6-bisphosphatase I
MKNVSAQSLTAQSPRLLQHYLESWAQGCPDRTVISSLISEIAGAGVRLSRLIVSRELEQQAGSDSLVAVDDSSIQPMAKLAHELFATALAGLPVSVLASAECSDPVVIDPQGRYAVAIDPLDGEANLEINLSIGSIFSILESEGTDITDLNPGRQQRAAGFLCYGPQTRLVLTVGEGTFQFLLDPAQEQFYQLARPLQIPAGKREFAINIANYRFWDSSLRHFIDDCIAGEEGSLGENFNMRWNGSLVAEAFRILVRGGVFLYPGDARPDYQNGRLRLLYHAAPLALIIEQAGGAASDGNEPILGMPVPSLHARVPLIFGCREQVNEVIEYISGVALDSGHFPLFLNRGLLRN